MMKKFIVGFVLLVILNLSFTIQVLAFDFKTGSGIDKTDAKTGHSSVVGNSENPADMIGLLIKAVLGLVGIVFLVLMLYAGFKWMTAKGNEQDVEEAKKTIANSIIGLIVVMAAYAATVFIGGMAGGDTSVDAAYLIQRYLIV